MAPSFHGNAWPFPPTLFLSLSPVSFCASPTPSLLSHFIFFSVFFPFFKDRLSIITLQPSFSSPISSLFLSYLLIFSLLSFSYLPIKCSLNPSSPKPSFTQVRHVPFLSFPFLAHYFVLFFLLVQAHCIRPQCRRWALIWINHCKSYLQTKIKTLIYFKSSRVL